MRNILAILLLIIFCGVIALFMSPFITIVMLGFSKGFGPEPLDFSLLVVPLILIGGFFAFRMDSYSRKTKRKKK